jgi:hypothetical protein
VKTYTVRYDAGTYFGVLQITTHTMKAAHAAAKRVFDKMNINPTILHIEWSN